MDPVRLVARSALSALFITGGLDAIRHPEARARLAAPVTGKAREVVGVLPEDDELLVKVNGGVHLAAGTLLALGKFPRLTALVLAGSLLPTTLGGHRFWELDDATARKNQKTHFTKNVAILGGLIFAVLDRQGSPSLGWRARRAAKRLPIGS